MPKVVPERLKPLTGEQTVICSSRNALMQRVSDVLKSGYTHVVQVQVELGKAQAVIEKLQGRFPMLGKTRTVASKAKAKGLPRHKAVAFWNSSAGHALVYLFTDRPEVADREKWMPVEGGKGHRVTFYEYEAVRHDRGGSLAWTWQMEKAHLQKLEESLVASIRSSEAEAIAIFIQETRTWPGFHRVRAQHKALGELLKAQWKRAARKEALPTWPRLYYLQRIKTC